MKVNCQFCLSQGAFDDLTMNPSERYEGELRGFGDSNHTPAFTITLSDGKIFRIDGKRFHFTPEGGIFIKGFYFATYKEPVFVWRGSGLVSTKNLTGNIEVHLTPR